MNNNEIKKELIKQSPVAVFKYVRKGNIYYQAGIETPDHKTKLINFKIPVNDIGEADFLSFMKGKELLRWIMEETEEISSRVEDKIGTE